MSLYGFVNHLDIINIHQGLITAMIIISVSDELRKAALIITSCLGYPLTVV